MIHSLDATLCRLFVDRLVRWRMITVLPQRCGWAQGDRACPCWYLRKVCLPCTCSLQLQTSSQSYLDGLFHSFFPSKVGPIKMQMQNKCCDSFTASKVATAGSNSCVYLALIRNKESVMKEAS